MKQLEDNFKLDQRETNRPQPLDLMQIFEGYVRNYRRMNLSQSHNRSMFTKREIDYFANLGEMLGFDSFVEDGKFDKTKGRSRPMDLAWWKYDARENSDEYLYLALHLERENVWDKDIDTIEKLFSDTEEGYIPKTVIGIQNIESKERINVLNNLIRQKNKFQKSDVLMIYRFFDNHEVERVKAYSFSSSEECDSREALCKQDELGCWFMGFVEELKMERGGSS